MSIQSHLRPKIYFARKLTAFKLKAVEGYKNIDIPHDLN